MRKTLKGKLYQKQKSHASWLVTKSKYNQKTSQVDQGTSIILQAETRSHMSEQQHIS